MTRVRDTLGQRKTVHGHFPRQAITSDAIITAMTKTPNWRDLTPAMRSAIRHFACKMSRIGHGDPFHADHWHDIGGYAVLVEDSLEQEMVWVAAPPPHNTDGPVIVNGVNEQCPTNQTDSAASSKGSPPAPSRTRTSPKRKPRVSRRTLAARAKAKAPAKRKARSARRR